MGWHEMNERSSVEGGCSSEEHIFVAAATSKFMGPFLESSLSLSLSLSHSSLFSFVLSSHRRWGLTPSSLRVSWILRSEGKKRERESGKCIAADMEVRSSVLSDPMSLGSASSLKRDVCGCIRTTYIAIG